MRTNTLSLVLVEIRTKTMCWIQESADTFHLNHQDSFIPHHGLQLAANKLLAKWSRYPDLTSYLSAFSRRSFIANYCSMVAVSQPQKCLTVRLRYSIVDISWSTVWHGDVQKVNQNKHGYIWLQMTWTEWPLIWKLQSRWQHLALCATLPLYEYATDDNVYLL